MEYVIIIGQLMLSLSILIVLHEMGHFFPAKWFNTRVEKFYLFFDPWFSLIKYKKGDTEYGIGWLPLGGYVKISGMIDESFDKEQMAQPPQPWEFRSKPAWQRLIIMLGGVTVNFILGFIIFGMVLFTWGEEYIPNENVTEGIHPDKMGYELGLRDGDKILSIGGEAFDRFEIGTVIRAIVIGDADVMTVEREGQQVKIPIPNEYITRLTKEKNRLFEPRIPFIISAVPKEGPAYEAGLLVEDKLIAVDGQPTPYFHQVRDILNEKKGQELQLTIDRGGQELNKTLTVTDKGKIKVGAYTAYHFFDTETQNFSFGQALPAGFNKGVGFLSDQIKAFGKMFSGDINPSDGLGGFGTIAKLFPTTWNWQRFWENTAILSLILAFMNLLPIPALDGGHVMFLLYEVVSGRKPSDKFMEYATLAGFVLILGLLVYANGLDIYRAFFK